MTVECVNAMDFFETCETENIGSKTLLRCELVGFTTFMERSYVDKAIAMTTVVFFK